LLKYAQITRELSLRTISSNGCESIGKLPLETSNCSCCHILGSPDLRFTTATVLDQAAAVTLIVWLQSAFLLRVPFLYLVSD
jgi:hypothetical protein